MSVEFQWGRWKVLERDGGDDCTKNVMCLMLQNCILNNGAISKVCYIYFTTLFLKRAYCKVALGKKDGFQRIFNTCEGHRAESMWTVRQTGFWPALANHGTNTLHLFSNFCFLISKMGIIKQHGSDSWRAFLKSKILLDNYTIYSLI